MNFDEWWGTALPQAGINPGFQYKRAAEMAWNAAIEEGIKEAKAAAVDWHQTAIERAQRCRELEADSRRLDWLLGKVSGAEYRRIGIEYEDRYSLLAAIDAALKER